MDEQELEQVVESSVNEETEYDRYPNPGLTPNYDKVYDKYSKQIDENQALQIQQQQLQAEQPKDQGFLPDNPVELVKEAGKAVYGGVTDAVESVGSTIDLLGDTIKTAAHKVHGLPEPDADSNIFGAGYKPEPIKYLDVPSRFEVTNESGLGNLTRGLVEFGFLIATTRGVGGTVSAIPRVSKAVPLLGRQAALKRAMGSQLLKSSKASKIGVLRGLADSGKGSKFIQFIPKRAGIFAEGAVADLISSSSDYANMANLVEEYAPWFPFAEWLAVDPDRDNPWTARMKTVFAGGGLNLAAHTIMGFGRGRWAAIKALREGKSGIESNKAGNIKMSESMKADIKNEIETRERLKQQDIDNGVGISDNPRRDYIIKNLDESNQQLYRDLTDGNLTDTRGGQDYFHGAADEFKLDESGHFSTDTGIYGQGLYSTDDLTTAGKYQNKNKKIAGKDAKRTIYKVEEKTPVNFYDLDQSLDNGIVDFLRKDTESFAEGWVDDALELIEGEPTLAKLLDSMRKGSQEWNVTRSTFQDYLDSLKVHLSEQGFGGFTHQGGKLAGKGKRLHQVKIYWDPKDQVDMNKVDLDDQGLNARKLKELEELADSNGAAKGNPWLDESNSSFEDSARPKKPTPDRNPNKFSEEEKAVLPDDPRTTRDKTRSVLKEMSDSNKATGTPESSAQLLRENILRRVSFGIPELRKFILEMSETIADEVFKSTKNTYNWFELQNAVLKQLDDMYSRIQEGGVDSLRTYIKENSKDKVLWMHDGTEVVTGNASQAVALQLLINSLAKRASLTAQGALEASGRTDLLRQSKSVQDSLVIALTEYKKIGYMYGQGLQQFGLANRLLPKDVSTNLKRNLKQIEIEERKFGEELDKLMFEGKLSDRKELLNAWASSQGDIRTMADLRAYLGAQVLGGRYKGVDIKGRWQQEAAGFFYNSILSALSTPINAIVNTGIIGYLRPYQAWLGAAIQGNKEEMIIAAAGIDALSKGYAESLQMFKHNWKLGVQGKNMTYQGKFDLPADIKEWKKMAPQIEKYGTPNEKSAYYWTDVIVDFNHSPWVRYSQNAMGAGDAFIRTLLGRVEMRMRAARKAIADNVDLDDIKKVSLDTEANFRQEIFKKDKYDMWVVRDEAAKAAGDETTLTKSLTGKIGALESIRNITGMRFFFPFVRTGINALDLFTQHTPILAKFHGKWKDLLPANGVVDPEHLLKTYGIRPEDIPQAQALMRGRLATGQMMTFLAVSMAMTGGLTGSLPADSETRQLWKINNIKPFSFKLGDTYISYQKMEPFNTLLGTIANTINYQHVLGEDLRDEFLQKAIFMASAAIVDKSMLAGVGDLAEIFNAQTGSGQLGRTLAKYSRAQFVPYASLFAQLGGIMDANEKEANNMLETIFKRDVIFKSMLPAKYDILNKDRSGKKWVAPDSNPLMRLFNTMSPIPIHWSDGDNVKENLRGMSFNMPEIMRSWKGERLNSREVSELQKLLSQSQLRARLDRLMKPGGRWEKQYLEFKAAGYLKRDGVRVQDQEFYRDVRKIFMDEKRKALQILRYQNPELYSRVELRRLKALEGRHSDYKAIERLMAIPK